MVLLSAAVGIREALEGFDRFEVTGGETEIAAAERDQVPIPAKRSEAFIKVAFLGQVDRGFSKNFEVDVVPLVAKPGAFMVVQDRNLGFRHLEDGPVDVIVCRYDEVGLAGVVPRSALVKGQAPALEPNRSEGPGRWHPFPEPKRMQIRAIGQVAYRFHRLRQDDRANFKSGGCEPPSHLVRSSSWFPERHLSKDIPFDSPRKDRVNRKVRPPFSRFFPDGDLDLFR